MALLLCTTRAPRSTPNSGPQLAPHESTDYVLHLTVMIPIIVRAANLSEPRHLRATVSRRAILEALRDGLGHPTADDIYSRVRLRLPRISMGTVYRNLDLLVRHGLVRTLTEPGGKRRYDASGGEHDHVWCISCGRIADVHLFQSARPEDLIEDGCGYDIRGHRLSFLGLCPKCGNTHGTPEERGGDHGA
jgi:Fe2+ or Zn2+ uptake regulation protein